jgi:predicted TPR repeat methyltransferase
MDCRHIGRLGKIYHAIMAGFCLPYLSKEETQDLIRDAAGILTPGGALYLSTMEDDYNKSGWEGPSEGGAARMYIHYHEAEFLTITLQENGFNIVDLRRRVYARSNGTIVKDLLIVAKKPHLR